MYNSTEASRNQGVSADTYSLRHLHHYIYVPVHIVLC